MAEPSPTDGELLAAVLAGESDHFAELVHRYEGPLLRAAVSRLGRREWAEEAVQETFLGAYRWLASYDSRYSFRTWLWTILLNQCHRIWQRSQRRPQVHGYSTLAPDERVAAETPLAPAREAPAEQALASERRDALARCLAELPPEQADALRLRFFGELKFHEIADAMGCSLGAAKQRVKGGLLKLAAALGAAGPHPVADSHSTAAEPLG